MPKLDWANEQVKDNEEEGDLAGGEDEEAEVVEGLLHLHQLPHCHHHLDLKLVALCIDIWVSVMIISSQHLDNRIPLEYLWDIFGKYLNLVWCDL